MQSIQALILGRSANPAILKGYWQSFKKFYLIVQECIILKVSTRREGTPPLREIESYLHSDRFSAFLYREDLEIVSTIINCLGSRVSDSREDIKDQLLSCDESIAVAGYLEGRYEAAYGQYDLDLEISKAELLSEARKALEFNHERVTESMVSARALQSAEYAGACRSKIVSQEIYKLFKAFKLAVTKRKDSIAEISYTERQMMRDTDNG